MKFRIIAILLLLTSLMTVANAQSAKKGTVFAQITASTKVTETQDGDDPNAYYTFDVTWKSSVKPEAIYYKAPDAWANCMVLKNGKEVALEEIKPGKLCFKTMSAGRFAIPEELKSITTPAIFFQAKGKWYYLPVKKMMEKKG